MSDLSDVSPVTEEDYARIRDYLVAHRDQWEARLGSGLRELTGFLGAAGYLAETGIQRPETMAGRGDLGPDVVVVSGRLKDTQAVLGKMRRFGEPLRVMLDLWGYRVLVATEEALDAVAQTCTGLWSTPQPSELLLRHGQLQFAPWRDYRKRDHAGLSAATTAHYDQAIHLNRKAPFGIVEIQVLTFDLYRRVHCGMSSEDSHDAFVARRQALLRGDSQ